MTRRSTVIVILASLALLAAVAVGYDATLRLAFDRGAAPIRAATYGDRDYYLLRLHAVVLEGRPIGSPFFHEHRDDPARFPLFESLVTAVRPLAMPFIGTHAANWGNLVMTAALLALFLELAWILRKWARLPEFAALTAAAAVCLWQEPFSAQVYYALGSWFMPFALGGVILAVQGFAHATARGRLVRLLGASLLFAVHPIMFTIGSLGLGFVWLARLRRDRAAATLKEAFAWGVPTFALGLALFGRFALDATAAAAETLARNAAIDTHLPLMPMRTIGVASLLALTLLCRRRAEDDRARAVWDVLAAWGAATLVGMNANVLTGRYFIGDHFPFFERVIVVTAAACALALPARALTRRERYAAVAAGAGTLAYALGWLIEHPFRSWLLGGTVVPYFLGCGLMLWTLFGGRRPRVVWTASRAWTAAVVALALSAAYAGIFLWRLDRAYTPAHADVQRYRPVVESLDLLPPGVALSDPDLAFAIAMHTAHRPYWTPRAFLDAAPDAELDRRWRDALKIFPDAPGMTDVVARIGQRGAENQFCGATIERLAYRPLHDAGFLKKTLCNETFTGDAWDAFAAQAKAEARTGAWAPAYRLDYLVLDRERGQALPPELTGAFDLVNDAGAFAIYRARP